MIKQRHASASLRCIDTLTSGGRHTLVNVLAGESGSLRTHVIFWQQSTQFFGDNTVTKIVVQLIGTPARDVAA
jgi:hypothetical protein